MVGRGAAMMLLLLGCAADRYSDPSRHYDCFRSVSCADGEVEMVVNAPVPRAGWTGSCPRGRNRWAGRADRALTGSPVLSDKNARGVNKPLVRRAGTEAEWVSPVRSLSSSSC